MEDMAVTVTTDGINYSHGAYLYFLYYLYLCGNSFFVERNSDANKK